MNSKQAYKITFNLCGANDSIIVVAHNTAGAFNKFWKWVTYSEIFRYLDEEPNDFKITIEHSDIPVIQ